MPVRNRHLKPAKQRLDPSETILFAAKGTLARTGAIARGLLVGVVASGAISWLSSVIFKHFVVYSFALPLIIAAHFSRRSAMDPGRPPFALAVNNVMVVTNTHVQVWAHQIDRRQPRRDTLTTFLGVVRRDQITGVTVVERVATIHLTTGHSIRSKFSKKDTAGLLSALNGAPVAANELAPAVAPMVPSAHPVPGWAPSAPALPAAALAAPGAPVAPAQLAPPVAPTGRRTPPPPPRITA